jgi:hypothetical protein
VSSFAKFKNDINTTKVPADLLGEVMVMWAVLPSTERDIFELRATRVLDLLAKKGCGKECGLLAMAITIRLMALDAVLEDGAVRGWILPGSELGISYLHADLLRAAAEEPVVEGPEGQPVFIAGSFRQRLLENAASRGCA